MRIHNLKLAAVGLAAFVAACASDSVETPPSNNVDIAAVISQTTLGDLNSFATAAGLVGLPSTSSAPVVVPSACTYATASGGFTCPSASAGGFTFRTSYFLYDAAGHSQSAADVATTSALRAVLDASGTTTVSNTTIGAATATVAHHSDMTLSGLLGATRTLNGTSTDHDDLATTGAAVGAHVVIDNTSTTTNVVLPAAGTSKWPQSGTITSDIVSLTSIGVLPAIRTTAHSVLTFNGTSIVNLVATISGRTTTCRVDLTGGTPSCS